MAFKAFYAIVAGVSLGNIHAQAQLYSIQALIL
jgi:hypothetical protein